jgi:ketosteroid isomerase-like protein
MVRLTILLAFMLPPGDDFARLRSEWALNLHEKHVEASIAEYAPDAEFIDPSGARVRGATELRQLFTTITQTFDSDLHFTSVRTELSGDLAYDSGTFDETLLTKATGKTLQSKGSYLTIYRRSKDGVWLIIEQIWTGTPVEVPAKEKAS